MNNKLQLASYESRGTGHGSRKNAASALILAVILTSLLAIIGVMFVMIARVDKMATSAISENKELNFAVETVVALVSQELVLDVPGMPKGSEYYDYPDANNAWLASLEPYDSGGYKWRQISDVTGFLNDKGFSTQNVNVEPVGLITTVYVHDYPVIRVDPNGRFLDDKTGNIATDGVSADADGDGIADSKWIKLDNITSNKGKPIYAAVRVVDNGAMLNVNTAYKFDPNETNPNLIDGSSQLQINLEALARGSGTDTIDEIDDARNPLSRPLSDYQDEFIWRIEDPCRDYLPFDISDELELRNRFFLTSLAKTRLEATWNSTIGSETFKRVPYDSDMVGWFAKFDPDSNEPDRRHLLTTYNMDRIIDPNRVKMANVNTADVGVLYNSIRKGLLDANYIDVNIAAQIAVNITDYRDSDSDVNYLDVGGKRYYGFETQPFISEIAAIIDTSDPNKNCYALELYNPFNISVSLNNFALLIGSSTNISLNGTIDPNGYFVISNDLSKFTPINTTDTQTSSDLKFSDNYVDNLPPPSGDGTFDSWSNYNITLKRTVGGSDIILDIQDTNNAWFAPVGNAVYAQRDTGDWHVVYQTMDPNLTGTLGSSNVVSIPRKNYNLSLANDKFVTVGDIARVLTVGPSPDPNDMIGVKLAAEPNEESVRLNLQNAAFQQIFNYLTVFDPYNFHPGDANYVNETRVKGRININTAPWYVIAQLPWMTEKLAQGIVAYRDAQEISGGPNYTNRLGKGFANIGQLNDVNDAPDDYRIGFYATDGNDLDGFPDLTAGDGARDDFEERDVVFARISNLVTVRSDVFTAYILVRIGTDGPQKRVLAILDRSDVYPDGGKVRIVALHPVPDPR